MGGMQHLAAFEQASIPHIDKLNADPSRMKPIGYAVRDQEGGHRTCRDILCIDDQALALIGCLIMDKGQQVAVIFRPGVNAGRKYCLASMALRTVVVSFLSARLIVIFYEAVEGQRTRSGIRPVVGRTACCTPSGLAAHLVLGFGTG